ncbi:MAG TPA: ABC transporter substrate-binding protein [Spirochaetia bacterium]|nr:ABC transporter substrate-binding protein [Spirochaetia bacterium]
MRELRRRAFFAVTVLLASGAAWAAGQGEASDGTIPFEARYLEMGWDEIVAEARGSEVYWYMWGGSDAINTFVQDFVAERLAEEYDIELEMVPVTDASVFVSKVVGEKQAGLERGGSVDLVWINGENFRSMRTNDLLFGPYADMLPNLRYVDTEDPTVANDFGFAVEGYESPYGSAQMVMVYDEARVPAPPTSIPELIDWARAHPGRLTYPAPPDFTGSAFVRHLFYHAAGGYEQLLGPFDQDLFDRVAPDAWAIMNELEPFLWREGRTYPETTTQQQNLFANSEVDFDMSYNPSGAANLVAQGRYPESTRTFVFESGTIGNTHFVAIPFNATHKPAAMVLANLLLDPAIQFEKARPSVWGDLPAVQVSRLPDVWQQRFASLPRPPSVLSDEILQSHRLPELQSTWLDAIERGWIGNVLER